MPSGQCRSGPHPEPPPRLICLWLLRSPVCRTSRCIRAAARRSLSQSERMEWWISYTQGHRPVRSSMTLTYSGFPSSSILIRLVADGVWKRDTCIIAGTLTNWAFLLTSTRAARVGSIRLFPARTVAVATTFVAAVLALGTLNSRILENSVSIIAP